MNGKMKRIIYCIMETLPYNTQIICIFLNFSIHFMSIYDIIQ